MIDRNRITGGGVTAGIDFALTVIAQVAGEEIAKALQLGLEYDPAPPFDCGSPDKADAATLERYRAATAKAFPDREAELIETAARLGFS